MLRYRVTSHFSEHVRIHLSPHRPCMVCEASSMASGLYYPLRTCSCLIVFLPCTTCIAKQWLSHYAGRYFLLECATKLAYSLDAKAMQKSHPTRSRCSLLHQVHCHFPLSPARLTRPRGRQQQQQAGGSGQGHDHLDVVDGEHARAAVHAALVPVVVDAAHERDEVPLVEAQLALVLGVEVVQRPAARRAGAPGW